MNWSSDYAIILLLVLVVTALVVIAFQLQRQLRLKTTVHVELKVDEGVERLRLAATEYADVLAVVKMLEQVTPETLEQLKAYPETLQVAALAHRASVLTAIVQQAHARYETILGRYSSMDPTAKTGWQNIVDAQQKLDDVRKLMPPGLRAV